jgi:ketosteroid isomerase-like protein
MTDRLLNCGYVREAEKGERMSVMAVDQWVVDLFRAIDSMDAATVAKAFAEDGRFRFGNTEPVVGREHVEQSVSGFFSMISGLSHEIIGVWSGNCEGGQVTSVEAEVTYTRKDGSRTQALPVTSTIRMESDRIKDYRIFMDVSPLFAQ